MLRGRTKLTTLNIKVIHEIQRSKRAYRLIFRVKIAGLTTSRQTPAQNQLHRTLSSLSDETWLNSGDICNDRENPGVHIAGVGPSQLTVKPKEIHKNPCQKQAYRPVFIIKITDLRPSPPTARINSTEHTPEARISFCHKEKPMV
jgi:hypothetical protein